MRNLELLSISIQDLDNNLRSAVAHSANKALTVRNWLIGWYIVEYEQHGEDRAKYGSGLLDTLSTTLRSNSVKGDSVPALRSYRQFYTIYQKLSGVIFPIYQTFTAHSQIQQKPSAEFECVENQADFACYPSSELLLNHFSFSHFVELMRITDTRKQRFYEIEGIKGCWSVHQLKRQIETMLYERTGLSIDKQGLLEDVHSQSQKATINDIIRDPYILEFTGFPEMYQFSEKDLESALLDHLQSFLLELGNGFCFEARQKRITLDNEHDRIDLVFYHRILRCHILIDLKIRKFTSDDACRMNFYLNYYRENIMIEGDNPPVGLILCTDHDETRVKYAPVGLDNKLFVSKYLTQLPSSDTLKSFLTGERERTIQRLQEERAEYRRDS
ncbi:MAG: DUF1016 domain-containing protein [Fibrobacter sp.]|nr:DUF1016 domain-containing protein [Fibrobacter sp.]